MSVLFRESRNLSYQSVWGSGQSSSLFNGTAVKVALSLIPVYAATGLIADMVASSPWDVFTKTATIPIKVNSQPRLITDPGVNELDLFSWKHQMIASMLVCGTAFGYINAIDSAGVPSQVQWLRPDWMSVDETGVVPVFYYNGAVVDRSKLIVIPMYVIPGSVIGLSPIAQFRQQIEMGLEAQRVGKNWFRRGAQPPAFLQNQKRGLTPEQAEEAKNRAMLSLSASEPFVAGNDWDYKVLNVPQADVSFLSSIKATATQVAAIYRVDPEDVGGEVSGSSLKYLTLETAAMKFASRTLLPITARVESVLNRHLPVQQYVKSNLDATVRADLLTRYKAYQIAIGSKFKDQNEVRALEESGPLTEDQINLLLRLGAPAAPAASLDA